MQIQDETWRKLKERTQTGVAAAAAGAVCDSHLLCPTGQTTEPEHQQ